MEFPGFDISPAAFNISDWEEGQNLKGSTMTIKNHSSMREYIFFLHRLGHQNSFALFFF